MAGSAPKPRNFSHADAAFRHSDAEAVATEGARRFGRYLAMTLGAMVVLLLAWARLSYIDEITRGDARVIPSGQNKIVQAPDAGVVKEILVKDGDPVSVGQPLMRIDPTPARAALDEKLARLHALMARVARLTAEAEDTPTIAFPDEARDNAPREVEQE